MKYTDAEIQKCIKSGLMAYKENAKTFYRNYPNIWKKLPLSEKVAVARSLAYMSQVAKEPKLYLAPEYTLADWRARAHKYTVENNLSTMDTAYLIVLGPKEIVASNVRDVISEPYFSAEFHHKYFNFLGMIQDYEYAKKGWEKEVAAEMVKEESRRVNNVLEINQTPYLLRPIKRMEIMFRSGNSK